MSDAATAVLSFDIEEHDRIEAARGLTVSPAAKRDYADRMEAATRWILAALDRAGVPATFFFVGDIAESRPGLIRDVHAAGHEVAAHGWDHRRVHTFTPGEFRDDVRRCKDALEQVTGAAVVGYRAPTFSVTRETAWAVDVLAEAGYRYDSSVYPVRHDRYGVPDAPRLPFMLRGRDREILELPPATLRAGRLSLPVGGGGYFRLFPPALMRRGVRQLNRLGGPGVLYFHPWEFDPDQPRLPLGRLSRWRTYVGVGKSRARLERLMRAGFSFRRMADVAAASGEHSRPAFSVISESGDRREPVRNSR